MRLYLQHSATGQFSDAADYAVGIPFEAPAGFEWVEGMPPENALPYRQPTLAERLSEAFATMPVEAQADLAPLKAAVKLELDQGRTEIARLIIERAQIAAGLEPLRQQMLDCFN